MQNSLSRPPVFQPPLFGERPTGGGGCGGEPGLDFIDRQERERQFIAMLRRYRDSGGLALGSEVLEMMSRSDAGSIAGLARRIVSREVLAFEWRGDLWLPLFQFDKRNMSLREMPRRIAAELIPAYDAWGLAHWYVQPNAWLGDRKPVEVLDTDPAAVLAAARADRFVVMG